MNGNEQDVQAFENKNVRGGTALPLFTGFVGFSCAAASIGTATLPASVGGVNQIVGLLERVGLDEGPLALFGFSLCALAATMWRAGRAAAAARASDEASLIGQQILGDLDVHGAALASLQAELGATRMELAELRQQAAGASTDGSDTASSPIFRMAASLDQLGAQVSTRIEATRAEFLEAVEGITARVDELKEASDGGDASQETSEQRELIESLREAQTHAAAENRDRFESVRGELAGLIEAVANLARPSEHSAAEPAVDEPESTMRFEEIASADFEFGDLTAEDLPQVTPPAPFGVSFRTSEQAFRQAEAASAPPPALVNEPFEAEISPQPFEDGAADEDLLEPIETGLSFRPELNQVTPTGAEEPQPALPAPSEGLELLEKMQEDLARSEDRTPPLFPELRPDPRNS